MNREYDVVVIDTGVEKTHFRLENRDIECIKIVKVADGFMVEYLSEGGDDVGHGTAVCDIIASHYKDVSILSIKVFDSTLNADESLIIDVLNYIDKNITCKIINMSLGISIASDRLKEKCYNLDRKGIVLIAAFDNDGSISYPATFDCVIGVTSCNSCTRNNDYIIMDNQKVNIGAKGGLQKIAWIGNSVSVGVGDSYACAHISGISVNLISQKPIKNKEQLLCALRTQQGKTKSDKVNDSARCKVQVANFHRVALFPFNKEMHALVRYADMLPFTIIGIYDIKYSPNIGVAAEQILKLNSSSKTIIKNIDFINWDEIDTLIIGHTRDLFNNIIKNSSLLHLLLSQAETLNKNVFSFDQLPQSFEGIPNFVAPPIYRNYEPIPFGKLYHIPKPVLAVFGTDSQQGKFSLQLALRKNLLSRGYKVGQLGTEPTSFLFEMDECVHFGYDSDLKPVGFEFVSLVNSLLNDISEQDVDIIITGCQSSTLLTNEGNLAYYPVQQINFLLGTLPDAVVLVVNPDDQEKTIGKTISFIESCVETKVIAIVVFPMEKNPSSKNLIKTHISETSYSRFKKSMQSRYNISVFILDNDNEIDQLTELIENFFG